MEELHRAKYVCVVGRRVQEGSMPSSNTPSFQLLVCSPQKLRFHLIGIVKSLTIGDELNLPLPSPEVGSGAESSNLQ